MIVPHQRHLVPLQTLDPVRAAPLGDAGITPYRAVRRADPWLVPGGRVLLIGCGGLGQFAVQYLRMVPDAGGDLIVGVSEQSTERLAHAMELGADIGLSADEPAGWTDALGGPADVVLDFVGTDATLRQAAAAIAPDGLLMLVGEAGGSMRVRLRSRSRRIVADNGGVGLARRPSPRRGPGGGRAAAMGRGDDAACGGGCGARTAAGR